MKTKMNKFRFSARLLLLALTAFTMQAKAQLLEHGFGAEDNNYISVLLRPGDPLKNVTLGNPDENDEDAQYHWKLVKSTPPDASHYFDDGWETKQCPVVYLNHGKWLFQVTRASKYGLQMENVIVDVSNSIKVTAEPKDDRCCWSAGETIKMDQFDIKTEPPGYESYVDLHENCRLAVKDDLFSETEQEITFVPVESCDYYVFGQTTIKVINSDMEDNNYSLGVGRDLMEIKKKLDKLKTINEAKKRIATLEDLVKPVKKVSPFEFSVEVGGSTDFGIGKQCCCGKDYGFLQGNASVGIEASASVKIPSPYPAIKIKLGIFAGVSLEVEDARFSTALMDCIDCNFSYLMPYSVSGGISLEVAWEPVDDILEVSATGSGVCSWDLKFDFQKKDYVESNHDFYITVKVKAKAVFAYYEYTWNYFED